MSYDEGGDKCRDCAGFAKWDAERAERGVEAMRQLGTLGSVRELTEFLES